MIEFTALIQKFADKGEKTGWSYIDIAFELADQLNSGCKKSFRVKGFLDQFAINGMALLPMGNGDFIMALNSDIRKAIKKRKGATLKVSLEKDDEFTIIPNGDLMECLNEEAEALNFFNSLPKSHRDYFTKWIESAKTEPTRIKRITKAVIALSKGYGYPEMIRLLK